jgi:CheY-like chemotaxis protein
MFAQLKKWFYAKKNHNELVIDITDIIPQKIEEDIKIPEVRIIDSFDSSKPSILIVDDQKGIISIIEDYMDECGINEKEYNILSFYGSHAAFVMQETLEKLIEKGLTKLDIAVVDIVLPGKKKVDGKYTKCDGIDVVIWLNKHLNLTNFVFYTGNVVSAYVGFINEKTDKFQAYFNKDMKDHIIYKGTGSDETNIKEFCKLLKKEKYEL